MLLSELFFFKWRSFVRYAVCVCELRGRLSKRLQDSVELKSDIHSKVGSRILLCVNNTYLEAN